MKPERWQQVDELFHSALERRPEERATFLDEACAGDESLRNQVETLLAAHERAGSFIESPAMEVEAREVAADRVIEPLGMSTVDTISHYRIISGLGAGGMGEVYLAEDATLGRKVALKLLPADFTRDTDRVRRFQQEARAASALNHPNIVTIHEIGQIDNRHFIAIEFIDGETLRQRMSGPRTPAGGDASHTSGKLLKLPEVLNIGIQTADALAAAHEAGIVHRDIKPENIMVRRRDGYVKVLDFGLAKLTQVGVDTEAPTRAQVKTRPGVVMGSVSYMSPEQARGENVDARTDLWSLGVVVYEMLAGCAPFERTTQNEVLASILGDKQPPPLAHYSREMPAELERIVNKALTKDREQRYQTAKDLLIDLRRLRQRLEVEAELERSITPEEDARRATTAGSSTSQQLTSATHEAAAISTAGGDIHKTSSAEYIVTQIKEHKRGAALVLAAFVLAIGALGYFLFVRSAKPSINSVAVMPFVNVSKDPNTEYLSDGISESLINDLSELQQLKVIARSSSFRYKGKEIDPEEVAKALGVGAIVTGRVIQRGDDLQISVELVNTQDKTQMWGEQYNRRATDLQAVQAEIARTVSEKLRLRLTGAQKQQLAKQATQNPEAYQLYLNGRFYARKGNSENARKALDYYNQAVALDPKFALAYASMAVPYILLGSSGPDPKELLAKGRAAAQKAVELDDSLAEAHSALASIKTFEWDWPGAENEFKRAIELNPNLTAAHGNYAYYLTLMGRTVEALAEYKRAQELDPLSIAAKSNEGLLLCSARRYDEAIQVLQNVIKMQPDFALAHVFLGFTYAMKGQYAEAIAAYQKHISLEGETTSTLCYLGYAYAKSGKRDEALATLNKLKTTKDHVSPAELAILYVGLGDTEAALDLLERAYQAHDHQMVFLKVETHYDALRSEARFQDLMRRVGLPQ